MIFTHNKNKNSAIQDMIPKDFFLLSSWSQSVIHEETSIELKPQEYSGNPRTSPKNTPWNRSETSSKQSPKPVLNKSNRK